MPTATIGDNTGDTYSGVEDNRIDSLSSPNYNYGLNGFGYAGNQTTRIMKELQRFDLSGLTSSWTVTAAVLYLYDQDWASRTADCTINVYQIAAANGDWIEGTTTGSAEVGSPCWNKKVYNTVNWAGSAGLSTATTDYINTSLGSAVFTDGVSGYRTITFNSSGESVVEDWLGDATNNGFLLVGSGSDNNWTRFTSSDGTDGQRPYLSVDYTTAAAHTPFAALNGPMRGPMGGRL